MSYSTEYIPKRTGTDSSPEYTDWRNDKEYYKGYNYNRFQFYAKHFEIACNYLIFRKNKVDFSLKDEIRERKQSARELRDYNKKLKKESKKPEQLDSTILAQIHAQPTTYTFFEDSLKTFDSLVINGLNNVLHKIPHIFPKSDIEKLQLGNNDSESLFIKALDEQDIAFYSFCIELARRKDVFEKLFDYSNIQEVNLDRYKDSTLEKIRLDSIGYEARIVISIDQVLGISLSKIQPYIDDLLMNNRQNYYELKIPEYGLDFVVQFNEVGDLNILRGSSYSEHYLGNSADHSNYNKQRFEHYTRRLRYALKAVNFHPKRVFLIK